MPAAEQASNTAALEQSIAAPGCFQPWAVESFCARVLHICITYAVVLHYKKAGRHENDGTARGQSEKDAKLAQKLGQLQPFTAVLPQECMGQTAIFWANLTPSSLRRFHLAKLPIAQRHWLDQGPEVGAVLLECYDALEISALVSQGSWSWETPVSTNLGSPSRVTWNSQG
jgi:hypothetical protein